MSQHRHAAVAEVTTSRERTRKAAQPVLDGLKVKCMTFCSAINTSLARALGRVDHRLACGMVDDVLTLMPPALPATARGLCLDDCSKRTALRSECCIGADRGAGQMAGRGHRSRHQSRRAAPAGRGRAGKMVAAMPLTRTLRPCPRQWSTALPTPQHPESSIHGRRPAFFRARDL